LITVFFTDKHLVIDKSPATGKIMKIQPHIIRLVSLILMYPVSFTYSADIKYPSKPIRMVQSSPSGGSSDALSREISNRLSLRLSQPVVIDNRPGGGGIIAGEITAKSQPDGYTLLFTGTHHSVLPSLHPNLAFHVINDFTPISIVAMTTSILVVNPNLPVKTVKDLIALAKLKPGQINYSAGATGGTAQLGAELLKAMAGVSIIHVPYRGGAAQLTALLSGEVQISFTTMPATLPHIKSHRLRPVAVAGLERSKVLPDVPTVAESGLPGFDIRSWNGILGPHHLPPAILNRLNTEIVGIVSEPEFKARISANGADPTASSPQEFGNHIRNESQKWAKVVKFANIKPD